MKVVAFNGSPRTNGNTAQSLQMVLKELEKEGIETELIQLGGHKVFGCLACGKCYERRDNTCARQDDEMNNFIAKMNEADGILIGSPTYFSNVSTEVKALIDRCGFGTPGMDVDYRVRVPNGGWRAPTVNRGQGCPLRDGI